MGAQREGVRSGPSSFCAGWAMEDRFVVAADPLYAHAASEIAAGFDHTASQMLDGMRRAHDRFIWAQYESPEAVVERRREALRTFLGDRADGSKAGRYVAAALLRLLGR